MEYQAHGRVSGRRGLASGFAVFCGAIALVVVAWWGGQTAVPRTPADGLTTTSTGNVAADVAPRREIARAPSSALRPPGVAPESANAIPRLPSRVACHELAVRVCHAAILAAIRSLGPDEPVTEAAAWRSLLCGDALQCPAPLLASHTAVGSVTLTFGGSGTGLWLNVLALPLASPADEADPGTLIAFAVRSVPGRQEVAARGTWLPRFTPIAAVPS